MRGCKWEGTAPTLVDVIDNEEQWRDNAGYKCDLGCVNLNHGHHDYADDNWDHIMNANYGYGGQGDYSGGGGKGSYGSWPSALHPGYSGNSLVLCINPIGTGSGPTGSKFELWHGVWR